VIIRMFGARSGPRLSELEDLFVLMLASENRSPGTIEHYRTRLRHLREHLGDVAALSIRPEMLRRFLLAVKRAATDPVSDRYVDQHRKTLVRFFGWAASDGHVPSSPAASLGTWRVDEREIRVLRPDQVDRLMRACDEGRAFAGARDRVIIATLYGTGVRRRELVEISLDDVDLEAARLHIRGKSRRWRSVPTGPKLREVLALYVDEVRPRVLLADSRRLFVDSKARELRPGAINKMLVDVARRAGVRGQVSPHVLRHSFGTEYIRNGGDRKALKQIMGHRTDAMLDRYVHFVESDVARDHAAASPFERLGARLEQAISPGGPHPPPLSPVASASS